MVSVVGVVTVVGVVSVVVIVGVVAVFCFRLYSNNPRIRTWVLRTC